MGFIYSYGRISEGRIPTRDKIIAIRDDVLHTFKHAHFIMTGGVYGSAARGFPGARSDLDIFYVYSLGYSPMGILKYVGKKAYEAGVYIDARVSSTEQARVGEHPFGPSYLHTWEVCRSLGMLCGEPTQYYKGHRIPVQFEMWKKMWCKLRQANTMREQVSKIQTEFGEYWRSALLRQSETNNIRPLHTYLSIARIALIWSGEELTNDDKGVVVLRFLNNPNFAKARYEFSEIVKLNEMYEDLFIDAQRIRCVGFPSLGRNEYERRAADIYLRALTLNTRLLGKVINAMKYPFVSQYGPKVHGQKSVNTLRAITGREESGFCAVV